MRLLHGHIHRKRRIDGRMFNVTGDVMVSGQQNARGAGGTLGRSVRE